MIVDIIMPKMGESITEGTILEWKKKPGDFIKKDEVLLEIGTDKVDSEIPSAHEGVIVEILANKNDVVDVGVVIARIETETSENIKTPIHTETETVTSKPAPKQKTVPEKKVKTQRKKFFTPVVLKIAAEKNIPVTRLESIAGTGKGGRVTKRDILTFSETVTGKFESEISRPIPEKELTDDLVEMDHMRQIIADHMRRSIDTSAHVYVFAEVDMTDIVNYVEQNGTRFKAAEGFNLTYTPFVIMAAAQALREFPEMNASLEGYSIRYHKHINMGMAVAVEKGLMVPVINRCEEINFLSLCRKVYDIASRTRNKQINPDELQGSTFTITNFGVFNVSVGTPIINQPNVGILGVGTITKKPVVIEKPEGDLIGIRSMMTISLGFDHRLIDGAGGSRFIDMVRNNLEQLDMGGLL